MDVLAKFLLMLLAVSAALFVFSCGYDPDRVELYKRLSRGWAELAHALSKKCKAQEELIQTQKKYIELLKEKYKERVTVLQQPRPLEDWGEDYGDVLWWTFPIEEPPYIGSPLDETWPGYHTHWTPFFVPDPPEEG